MNLIFCHSKKKCKNRWKGPNPKFRVQFHLSKIFFFAKKNFPQFLYFKNQRKNTSPFGFFKFCYFQPYLMHSQLYCAGLLPQWHIYFMFISINSPIYFSKFGTYYCDYWMIRLGTDYNDYLNPLSTTSGTSYLKTTENMSP